MSRCSTTVAPPNDPSDDITLMHGYLDVLSAIGGSLVGDTNGDGVLDGDRLRG